MSILMTSISFISANVYKQGHKDMKIATLASRACVMSTTEQMYSASGNSQTEELNNINISKGSPHPMGLHWVKRENLLSTVYAVQHV